jgi:SAM-dependent MidA family methyltransferase
MEEALYSELGFFNTDNVRSSEKGDFLTSPEVSNYFGVIIRSWIDSKNFYENIVELGSGTGSLIEQIDLKNIIAIELSSTARQEMENKGILNVKSHEDLNILCTDLVYGNEILDNVPCSIAVFKENDWYEKVVDITKDRFSYAYQPIRDEQLNWINLNKIEPNKHYEVELQTNIDNLIGNLNSRLQPKSFLFFDYGYLQKNRQNRKYKSLIRTYKNHHLSVDPLDNPGNVDITYDINFSAVKENLKLLGYKVSIKEQREFLLENGFNDIYDNLKNQYLSLEGIEKLKINSALNGLKAILDSNGLGGFYCLIAEKI